MSSQYANRANLDYIEELYQQYKQTPQSLAQDWQRFFEGFELGLNNTAQTSGGLSDKELNVYHLIQAYRNYGHYEAHLDPLSNTPTPSDQLSLKRFGLGDADLDQKFQIGSIIGKKDSSLREILAHLKQCYCGKLTVQCAEAYPEVRDWFIREFEIENQKFKLDGQEKKDVLTSLIRAESLEKFIHTRYVGTKRFSIEGGDSLLPLLETLVSRGARLGMEEIMVGMAHRGRVNVLANFMG